MKKIDCSMAEQWVVRSLDEGLSPDERERLDEHLRECTACARTREETQEVLDLVTGDIPPDPGEEFWRLYDQSLAARLWEKEIKVPWWSGWKVAAAAVLSGIVILSVLTGNFDRPMKDTPEARQIAVEVANELAELYGPLQDESPYYGLSADQILTPLTSQALYNSGIASWFEVEDDPDQLFM